MAGAIIVIDQPAGAGAGSAGVARNDLWQSKQVNLSVATGGNSTYQWDLLDVPPGSAAILTGASSSTANFTPDLAGTYRIQLITNSGGPGNVQILVARVRFDSVGAAIVRGWGVPAYGEQASESNYGGNARGWAVPLEFIFADVLDSLTSIFSSIDTINSEIDDINNNGAPPLGPAGGDLSGTYPNPTVRTLTHVNTDLVFTQAATAKVDNPSQILNLGPTASAVNLGAASVPVASAGPLTVLGSKVAGLPTKIFVPGVSGRQQTAQTSGDEIGAFVFDPSVFFAGTSQVTRTFQLVAVLECGVAGQTCTLELFNYTDNVTVTSVNTTNTTASIVTSAALTVPGNLPNSQKLYTLRLTRTGGSSSDYVTCKQARLEVIYS